MDGTLHVCGSLLFLVTSFSCHKRAASEAGVDTPTFTQNTPPQQAYKLGRVLHLQRFLESSEWLPLTERILRSIIWSQA